MRLGEGIKSCSIQASRRRRACCTRSSQTIAAATKAAALSAKAASKLLPQQLERLQLRYARVSARMLLNAAQRVAVVSMQRADRSSWHARAKPLCASTVTDPSHFVDCVLLALRQIRALDTSCFCTTASACSGIARGAFFFKRAWAVCIAVLPVELGIHLSTGHRNVRSPKQVMGRAIHLSNRSLLALSGCFAGAAAPLATQERSECCDWHEHIPPVAGSGCRTLPRGRGHFLCFARRCSHISKVWPMVIPLVSQNRLRCVIHKPTTRPLRKTYPVPA